MSTYWRAFCVAENDFVYEWSNTRPTVCPNNSEHTVYEFADVDNEQEVLRMNPVSTTNTNVYNRALLFHYNAPALGILRRIKAIIYCDGTTTNFDVKCIDITNRVVVLETNCTNTNPSVVVDLGVVSSSPTGQCVMELQIKRGNGNGKIYLYELCLYRGLLE